MSRNVDKLPSLAQSRVLLAVPNTGHIHKNVVFTIINLLKDPRANTTFIAPTHSPTIDNRHRITKDFINGGFDYLISIDSDNPPRRNIIDLISLGLDVIGCPTPVWANMLRGDFPIYWNALLACDDGFKPYAPKPGDGLIEVDAVGAGCIIIARRVLEKLQFDHPFMDEYDKHGIKTIGHDYSFCTKAKKAGFKVYAHYGYPCMHFNELELGEVISAFADHGQLHSDGIPREHMDIRDSLDFDNFTIDKIDWNNLYKLIKELGPKRVLEYGPGVSTVVFKILVEEVHSIEEERAGFDTVVEKPIGKYDLAFIDGPRGTPTLSRESSVIEAMKHTDCIVMHDTNRPGERQTIRKHLSTWASIRMDSKRGMIIFRRS